MFRKLKPILLVVSVPHLVFLFLWFNFIRNVKSFGCNTRQKVEQKTTQNLFINYRRSSHTSLKASKILSLIPPPLLPPSPAPSLFDAFQDTLNTFVGDVRQIQLDFDTSHVVNLKDQASKLLPNILEMIKKISSTVGEYVSPFGHANMDFSMPDISLDIHSLAMLFQGFEFDSSLKTIGVVSKLQSEILQSYPQLNMFIQLRTEILSTDAPAYTFFASTIITYALVNAALSQHASSPSRPYPMNKYDALTARAYFDRRPLLVTLRGLTIGSRSLQFGLSLVLDQLQEKVYDNEMQRGRELAVLLTRLGPTFIKIGQSLSIRSDLLRPAYIRGLETLQDQVPAFDTKVAKRILEAEWGKPITTVLSNDLSAKPVAAASLGQVYKARLRESNKEVAIKVQRPDIVEQIALDMYLIRAIGGIVRRLAKLNTDIVGTVDAWGIGFINELDYLQEAENGENFSELILETPLRDVVFAPTVLREFTTRSVLVSSWVNGDRLDRSVSRDVSLICSIAMNTYLTMLLEFGLLHCDPHPGNLLRTSDGKLCIMDWGMVTRLDSELQLTLIEHMAHLTSADYGELPRDLLLLGFVPEDKADIIDDSGVVDVLADIYGAWTAGGGAAAINVNDVISQLQDLTAKKGNLFRIPPYFAYIAKSFSVLEGIGLTNDPTYSIINECLPYVSKRLLTDNAKMGPALSTFIFGPDKSNSDRIIDYRRVEQLIEGFGEYTLSASGVVGKESLSRFEIFDDLAEQVFDLVFTENETPLQKIFIEQMAKILTSNGRILLTQILDQSGLLPSGRSRIGVLLDPLGVWRTSPLIRANDEDERTIETAMKLVALMRRQFQISGKPLFNHLTTEESFELSSIMIRKVWAKRNGVLQTSNRFARQLLQLTAEKLENGERNTRRILESRSHVKTISENTSQNPHPLDTNVNRRLSTARRILQESQMQDE